MEADKGVCLPAEAGYRMPAEWEPHAATWLAWPQDAEAWSGQLERVEEIYVEMARALSPGENVRLLVNDGRIEEAVALRLQTAGVEMDHVSFFRIETADVWMRDYGPTFLTRDRPEERVAAIDWRFNAWGGKYGSLVRDDGVAREIARTLGLPAWEAGLVLEGGSIDVNGRGTCLTTEQCLLNRNRNSRLERREIEAILGKWLGVDRMIWLGEGIAGDDTDGHVDDIARFVNPSTVVCALEADPEDENYGPLKENYERLKGATDQNGEPLTVLPLPQPGRVEFQGKRLPASYANFYIANRAVLVPIYNHPNDRAALELLESLFPLRRVVGIPCGPLLIGLGAIHCVTQQEPAP